MKKVEKQSVLFVANRLIASNIIGIIKPMLELQREQEVNFRMRYAFNYKESDIQWADVVVLCRAIDVELLRIIELVQKHHKRLVYDIDDNFFELSIQNPLGKYHRWPLHLYTVREMICNADAVRVYSRPMEENALKWNQNTFRLKSYFDFKLIEDSKPDPHEKIRIVYASGRGNTDALAQLCLPAVAGILAEYPESVEFYIFGSIPKYMKHLKNIHKCSFISDYSKYIKFSYSMGFDIGLAPLLDDRYHNSKTNNKYREYGAMGVCGIYSNAAIYRECITDKENGILVENTSEAWSKAIRELLSDKALRKRIKEKSYKDIYDNYSMENTLKDWRKILSLPEREKQTFRNYQNCRVSVLYDEKHKDSLRLHQLIGVLHYSKMDYKLGSFQRSDLWRMKDNDICICFVSKPTQVDQWLSTLKNYGYKKVVVDTFFPYDKCARYPGVVFTNAVLSEPNGLSIPDLYSLEGINLKDSTMETIIKPGNGQSFHEIYQYEQTQVNRTEEEVYSLNSPMIQWMDLLAKYVDKDRIAPGLIKKVINKLLKTGNKLGKLTSTIGRIIAKPFVWIYHKTIERVIWFVTCSKGSIKINRFKNY